MRSPHPGKEPVEGHMFEEVRQPLLVVLLHQGTRVHVEPNGDPVGRFRVRQDGVAEAIERFGLTVT